MATQGRRRSIAFPLLVVASGAYLLAFNLGVVDVGPWGVLATWWPVILVAIGLDLLLGRVRGWAAVVFTVAVLAVVAAVAGIASLVPSLTTGDVGSHAVAVPVGPADAAVVDLRLEQGSGTIGPLPVGASDLLAGRTRVFEGSELRTRVRDSGTTRRLTVSSWHRGPTVVIPGASGPQRWQLGLARALPTELRVEARAADLDLSLSGLTIPRMEADIVASSVTLALPDQAGDCTVRVEATLSHLVLRIPDGVAARVRLDRALSSVRITAAGLRQVRDDLFEMPGYDSARRRADIVVDARVARIDVVS